MKRRRDSEQAEESKRVKVEEDVSGFVFGRHLLPRIAESEDYDLELFDPECWEILAAAVEYKIRTLTEEAARIARRSCRQKLILDGISIGTAAKVLGWENIPFPTLPTSQGSSLVVTDAVANDSASILPPSLPSLSLRWVSVLGSLIGPADFVRSTKSGVLYEPGWRFADAQHFKRDFLDCQSENTKFVMSVILDSKQQGDTSKVLCVPKSLEHTLSEEQYLYLERIASVIMTVVGHARANPVGVSDAEKAHDKLALDKILRSLGEGPTPEKLVPYLLALTCKEISNLFIDGPCEGLMELLRIIKAMAGNSKIKIYAYLHQVLNCLLTCLLSPLIGGSSATAIHQAMRVRQMSAEILHQVVSSVTSHSFTVMSTVVEVLRATLEQPTLPIPTLVGAVLGARALGPAAMQKAVIPNATDLMDATKQSLSQGQKRRGRLPPDTAEMLESLKTSLLELLILTTAENHLTQTPG